MKTALQAFAFDSHAVRVVTIDDAPWFVAKDVCECLGIEWKGSGLTGSLAALDKDEKGLQTLQTLGGQQEMAVINESGLYTLTLRCRDAVKPGTPAHTFRKWVTSEVLPSIRKTGGYAAPGSLDARIDRLLVLVEQSLVQSNSALSIATRALAPKPPRKPHRPVTPEEGIQAREWKAQGMSQNEIARQLNRSTATVSFLCREVH